MVEYMILAAGQGTRMESDIPKVMHFLGGKPILQHVLDEVLSLEPTHVSLILSPSIDQGQLRIVHKVTPFILGKAWGTGYAVREALGSLKDLEDDVGVICGDTPLLTSELLLDFGQFHRNSSAPISLLAMRSDPLKPYGRLITKGAVVSRIVEYKDATEEEQALSLCNSGVLMTKGRILQDLLPYLKAHGQEYYLTDLIELASARGIKTHYREVDALSLQGINTRLDLAEAEETLQERWRKKAMLQGVTMTDPKSIFLNYDTILGKDVCLGPNVTFGPKVVLKDKVKVLPNCHIEESVLEEGVIIGPFAHLRNGCVLKKDAQVGNFVEVKNATLGPKVKVKH